MVSERVERPGVGGHGAVREEARDQRLQPSTLCGNGVVHAVTQFRLDLPKLRSHAVSSCLALKLEGSAPTLSTDEREPQEGEGFRFAKPSPLAPHRRMAAELQQARLLPVKLERELLEPQLTLYQDFAPFSNSTFSDGFGAGRPRSRVTLVSLELNFNGQPRTAAMQAEAAVRSRPGSSRLPWRSLTAVPFNLAYCSMQFEHTEASSSHCAGQTWATGRRKLRLVVPARPPSAARVRATRPRC